MKSKKTIKPSKFKKVSIVIPVYNEKKFISEVVKLVVRQRVNVYRKKEVIIVDDCSTDSTKNILKNIGKKYRGVKIIYKNKNEGKGAALKTGFLHTTGDVVIVQDADMEYSPEDYNFLLEPFIRYDADVVYGSRFGVGKPHRIMYFWHDVINNFLTTLSNIFTNLNLTDMEIGFKCFKGDLIREITPNIKSKRFGFEPEITAKVSKIKNVRIYEVGVSYNGRSYEEGKKINWVDGLKAMWEILRFNLFN